MLHVTSRDIVNGGEEFQVAVTAKSPKETAFSYTKKCTDGLFYLHLLFDYVKAVYCSRALIRRKQGTQDLNKGCFTCPVGTKKPEEFPFSYRKVKVVDGVDALGFTAKWAGVWGFEFVFLCEVDCLDGVFVIQPWTPLFFMV